MRFVLPAAMMAVSAMAADLSPEDRDFFEKKIRPVLSEHCYECHGAEKQKGGLRLDSRDALRTGGDSGPAIEAGAVEKSLLIRAIRYTDKDLAMPPSKDGSKKLPAQVIKDFEAWVQRGAPDPRSGEAGGAIARSSFDYEVERKKWAFRQPERPAVPTVKEQGWVKNPVDAFILARLEAAGMKPAPAANGRTLIRRMTFDLTGLPPAPDEIAAFERAYEANPQVATAELVDRLLASPAYGERWARHWLDLVRYADSLDSRGSGKEGDILDAWRYRDWVVSALNKDLPYDQFVTQQIAGDILAAREWDAQKVVATSVFAIGNWGNGDSDKQKVYTDIVDDQVDVVGRAFLGLTLACARCHDHKFDPITTADYYGLAGFFFSSHILAKFASPSEGERLMRIPLESPDEKARREDLQRRLAAVEKELGGGLRPTTEYVANVLGKQGLMGMRPKGTDNPSLVVNRTDAEIAFLTIKLPARAIAMHPGPKTAATLAWRSPIAGKVRVVARVRDVDPNCGNGVEWLVRAGKTVLVSGTVDNGRGAELPEREAMVNPGDLVQVLVKPRGEYTCDSTQVEFVVRAEGGRVWDARDILSKGEGTITQPIDNVWWFCEGEGERFTEDTPNLAALAGERDALKAQLTPPPMTQGLQEGGIPGTSYAGFHDAKIHVRGRYDRLGQVQPRGFPELFSASAPAMEGSGRPALAEWVASANNPLTARVMVNRLWQHHFGEGLVRTPNNFGKLGEAPTHPELLDWLAHEFVASGWSVKAVHRLILLSAVYQQQTSDAAKGGGNDPENRLFGRQNRRKLTAEELRDGMLAVSGALDRKVGGPSVPDLNAVRRTLYITTVRSDRSTYQMLFDGADPTGMVEKRIDSVIAPQALWLLNHPFALAQSKAIAARLEREGPKDAAGRVDWICRQLYGRAAEGEEVQAVIEILGANSKLEWGQICQTMLCANEFIYVD